MPTQHLPELALEDLLTGLETDPSLFQPDQLRQRLDALDTLDALDALDAGLGESCPAAFTNNANARIHTRAQAIRTRLEACNAELYQSIRSEIMRGAGPQTLLRSIQALAHPDETGSPATGLAYDYCDELMSGILQIRAPGELSSPPGPEMVFYQPTPARHILHLIKTVAFSENDVFIDFGSGLGHVPLLVSMLTGIPSSGIELEATYVASARECAESLQLSRVRFVQEDARTADLSGGTVFYLYSPFTGSILADVLGRLRKESFHRPIKVCTFGPCTCTVAKEPWLRAAGAPDPGQITIFRAGA